MNLDVSTGTCYTDIDKPEQERQDDADSFCVSRKYLQESNGRVFHEKSGEKAAIEHLFPITSAATSREEIGNPVHPSARKKLAEHRISCTGHAARQMTSCDYVDCDLLIGMDQANVRNMRYIFCGDPTEKINLLMEYAG